MLLLLVVVVVVARIKRHLVWLMSFFSFFSPESLKENVDTTHMLYAGYVVTRIYSKDGLELYFDEKLSASDAERPLVLVPGKETSELLREISMDIEKEVMSIKSNPIQIQLQQQQQQQLHQQHHHQQHQQPQQQTIGCNVNFHFSQLDGKALKELSGIGGTGCTACTASPDDIKDESKIEAGFQMDRTIEGEHERFRSLAKGRPLLPPRPSNEKYEVRRGLTQEPATSQNITKNITG